MSSVKRALLFLCLALAFFSILPVHATSKTFIVYPNQNATQVFQSTNGSAILDAGVTVSGWVRVSGGQTNDIEFYVTDPSNVTVAIYGKISYVEFSFVASVSGVYTAHFDNSGSINQKEHRFQLFYDTAHTGDSKSPLLHNPSRNRNRYNSHCCRGVHYSEKTQTTKTETNQNNHLKKFITIPFSRLAVKDAPIAQQVRATALYSPKRRESCRSRVRIPPGAPP